MESPFTINLDYQQVGIISESLINEINKILDSSESPQFRIYSIVKIKGIARRLLHSVSKTAQKLDNEGHLPDGEKECLMKYLGELKEIISYRTLQCLDSDEIQNFNMLEFLSSVNLDEFKSKDEPELWNLCAKQITEKLGVDFSRDWWDKI
jgi:hypothetical protein